MTTSERARAIPGHGWVLAGCLLLLLGLFVALVASTQLRPGERRAVDVLAPAPGTAPGAQATLRFTLPAGDADGGRWALWFPREMVEGLQLRAADGWRSESRGFFRVDDDEGMLPTGYGFVLPDWQGPVELALHADGPLPASMRPVLARAVDVRRIERSGVALAGAVYGGLLTLAAMALALAHASRDRLFVGFFGYVVVLVLLLQARNGHLYGLPGASLLGAWREQGVAALALVYAAAWLALVRAYAMPGRRHRFAAPVRGLGLVLLALAAVCLLRLPALGAAMERLTAYGWLLAGTAGLAMLVDGARRGVVLSGWLIVTGLVPVVAGAWAALVRHGLAPDVPLVHLGYQGGAVAFVLVLGLALVQRIADYRDQRDRDRLARLDTERRMRREAARANLSAALHAQLAGLDAGELPGCGFRLLVEHLMPLVPAESCAVVLRGYLGRDRVFVEPAAATVRIERDLAAREHALRRQVAAGIALQQPAAPDGGVPAVEALVPLQMRTPVWGVLAMRRAGDGGFLPEEMALIAELLRLVQQHVDQAAVALKLRRSAEVDALTGTMNRRMLDQWVVRSFAEAVRDERPVSVLFVDLDHFKSVNDRYGHACGDDCLRRVAAALQGALTDGAVFGRYGGEEFIVVLPGHDAAHARLVGERMRMAVEDVDVRHEGQRVALTVSIGIASRRAGERTAAETLARADKALYSAKREGRNRVRMAPAVFA
ncbi:GGDEF domain-containing protein [Luteimonas sp. FCS-9]|uniref:GGDEF domain-containing protein n=2 Tax=Luteimonas sp. FCS-9 TaxID=1547516 RepID=UPI000AC1120F|nr:GGDEF domain-containing protein [Luteimonas sp. FCS-9]